MKVLKTTEVAISLRPALDLWFEATNRIAIQISFQELFHYLNYQISKNKIIPKAVD